MAAFQNKKVELSISIVTFNSEEVIYNCLKSIFDNISNKIKYEVLVFDNNSTDKTVEIIENNFHYVRLIKSEKNIGFGRGHNVTFKKSTGDFFLVFNPDIILKKNTIESLISFMKKNKNIGIISPKILNPDGTIQYLCKRYPTVYDLFIRWINIPIFTFLLKKRLSKYVMKDSGYNNVMEVENMTGAFMLIRKDAFKKVGGFDENLFLYFEDTDLSRRIAKYYKVIYYPYVDVVHFWNKAHYRNPKMFWYYIKSMIYYFNKWGWKFF